MTCYTYHPAKFHRPASTHAGDICYKYLRTKKERNKEKSKRRIPSDGKLTKIF